MNRNNLWRFVLVVVVVAWSLIELYPPKGRDLIQYFRERSVNHDVAFSNILVQVQALAAVVKRAGATMAHVKPHGALYNQAVKNEELARTIARGVARFP